MIFQKKNGKHNYFLYCSAAAALFVGILSFGWGNYFLHHSAVAALFPGILSFGWDNLRKKSASKVLANVSWN